MKRGEIIAVVVVLLLLLGLLGEVVRAEFVGTPLGALAEVVSSTLLGWAKYPARVLPRIRFDLDGIAAFALCLGLLSAGGHRFLCWIYAAIQAPKVDEQPLGAGPTTFPAVEPWRWRWTLMLATLIVVVFALCISAGLVFHQIGWLITGRYSVIRTRMVPYPAEVSFRSQTDYLSVSPQTRPSSDRWPDTRELFHWKRMAPVYLETMHLGFIPNRDGTTYAVVACPRDAVERQRLGVLIITSDGQKIRPAADWPGVLDELRAAAATQPADAPSPVRPATDGNPVGG